MNLLKNKLAQAGLVVAVIAGAFYLGRTTAPSKVETQYKTDVIKDTVTIVREVKRPDGTVEKETTTQNTTTVSKELNKKVESNKANTKINLIADYKISEAKQVYGASFEKRIVGGIWAGVSGKTDGTVGVTVGMEF